MNTETKPTRLRRLYDIINHDYVLPPICGAALMGLFLYAEFKQFYHKPFQPQKVTQSGSDQKPTILEERTDKVEKVYPSLPYDRVTGEIKIDDVSTIVHKQNNQYGLEDKIEIKINFSALEDCDDLKISPFIQGWEARDLARELRKEHEKKYGKGKK